MSVDRDLILKYRRLLRVFDDDLEIFPEGFQTDQQKKVTNPPLQKQYPEDAELVDLVNVDDFSVGTDHTLFQSLLDRRSHRAYTDESLSLEELSYLLWASDGVHEVTKHHGSGTKRTVPSGGARHPYEIYILVNNVTGLSPGIYRYLAIEHKLLFIKSKKEIEQETLEEMILQPFILKGSVIFFFVTLPYRMEWRYSIQSFKVIGIEAGHICQNLYLACEALNLGTCAIAAYNQEIADEIIGVDGEDEFTVYLAPVGKKVKST
ncbi:MAG: SagB/ThcOx family dehydrogenase [Candidatus Heimdallarchaeota archaeon]|nr:SagB/ThcOx family dehydrogenase [Candidatus Heimdallarchaeota archaeon]